MTTPALDLKKTGPKVKQTSFFIRKLTELDLDTISPLFKNEKDIIITP